MNELSGLNQFFQVEVGSQLGSTMRKGLGFNNFFKNQGLVLDTSNLFHLIAMIMDYSV